jgi:hypothetical protein
MARMASLIQSKNKTLSTPHLQYFKTSHSQNVASVRRMSIVIRDKKDPLSLNPPVLGWPMARILSVIQNIKTPPPTVAVGRAMTRMSSVFQSRKTPSNTCVRTSHGQNVFCVPEKEDPSTPTHLC